MTRDQLAATLYRTSNLRGDFLLRSGARSNHYFDKYLFESHPHLLKEIALALIPLIPAGTEALAGLELGGVPIATVLSQLTGLPTLFVRKKAKPYGTRKLAEGGPVARRRLLIIEDVVTSGGQALLSSRQLRQRGAQVQAVLCVIDREAGGREKLATEQLELLPLFTMSGLEVATKASNDTSVG